MMNSKALKFIALPALIAALGVLTALAPVNTPAATPNVSEKLNRKPDGRMLFLDFYSPYCGACRAMDPHLFKLKKQLKSTVRFKRVDLSWPGNDPFWKSYDLAGTPTYVLNTPDGKPIFRMDGASPGILKAQIMRLAGQLKPVEIPASLSLTFPAQGVEIGLNNMILLSFGNAQCKACQQMTPFLDGFNLAELRGLQVVQLDIDTPTGREMAQSLNVHKLPTYVVLDNRSERRGELFRAEGETDPRELWEIIRLLGQSGI